MLDTLILRLAYFSTSIACVGVGVVYFWAARRGTPLGHRLLGSAYAPLVALLYVASTFYDFGPHGGAVYAMLQVVPLALFFWSLGRYEVSKWVHAVLVPIALGCWAWQAVSGYLGLAG